MSTGAAAAELSAAHLSLMDAIHHLRAAQTRLVGKPMNDGGEASRALAIVRTHLETAELWLVSATHDRG